MSHHNLSLIHISPYTPYDEEKSSLVEAWNAQGRPYYDYSKYNTERLPNFAQLDIRVDKSFYFHRCMVGFYLDLQNITGSKLKQQDVIMSTGAVSYTHLFAQKCNKQKSLRVVSNSN